MSYEKGDLVLISDGQRTSTCIILTEIYRVASVDDYSFYYTYCLETGTYGVVYEEEIISLVTPNFAPDFEFASELFDTHYSYYSNLYEEFSYFPQLYPFDACDDDDTSEDDEP